MQNYEYYTGNPSKDVFIHGDSKCNLLDVLHGDMTEKAAYRAIRSDNTKEPCPVCCDLKQ